MKLNLTARIVLTIFCFGAALIGFMVRLPSVFRHHDTELHTLFYLMAAGFLNVLFVKRNLAGHVLVFILLYGMGVGVEYAQEYSNSLVRERIHGRYDPEDIDANLKGLIYFSILWVAYVIVWYATRSMRPKPSGSQAPQSPANPVVTDLVDDSTQNELSRELAPDRQDEAKLESAIQLLTEVVNRNPHRRLALQLRATIAELQKTIQASKSGKEGY